MATQKPGGAPMTVQTWPEILPRPERSSWQNQLQESRQARQNEYGPPAWRRKFSSVARLVSLSVLLDRNQKAVFDTFYEVTCGFGSAMFWMPDPTTDGWPLLTSDGAPILTGDGAPLLLSGRWLCLWGDQGPVETVTGTEFRKFFSVVVMP